MFKFDFSNSTKPKENQVECAEPEDKELPAQLVPIQLPSQDETSLSEISSETRIDINPETQTFDLVSLCGGEFTLRKAAVSAPIELSPRNVDIVSGSYEGGFKLWESAIDLAEYVHSNSAELVSNRHVLELGAGHGLPSVVALRAGAASLTVHDYNIEVLRTATAYNLHANINSSRDDNQESDRGSGCRRSCNVEFVAGGWSSLPEVLKSSSPFDTILAAETVYSPVQTKSFCFALVRLLRSPTACAVIAAKQYYFGVGGGLRDFETQLKAAASQVGVKFTCNTVSEKRDGVSNVREIVVVRPVL